MSDWPVRLRGVTESVVTTLGPNDRYNVAALGIRADNGEQGNTDGVNASRAGARTWGRTRTWRNFTERGEGYVQFVRDPVLFVDATMGIREVDDPVLADADAWVRVGVEQTGAGSEGGTEWVDWRLVPVEHGVRRRVVPAFDRGYAAVVEATVAASRLNVDAYDTETLRDRIDYFEGVGRRCGGPRVEAALDRFEELVDIDGAE
jgi:hypothetical protein